MPAFESAWRKLRIEIELDVIPMRGAFFFAAGLLVLSACGASRAKEPEDYYVVQSLDARRSEWTVVHHGTWEGQRQRREYVLECLSRSDEVTHEKFRGPDACSLPVGARLASDVEQLTAVMNPKEPVWWNGKNRAPLFVIDMTNVGLLTVAEWSKHIGGEQVEVNYFRVIKASAQME